MTYRKREIQEDLRTNMNELDGSVVHLKIITGSTYLTDLVYEVRFSDLSKSRINFKDIVGSDLDSVIIDSGRHSDFGKIFIFETRNNETLTIPSALLHGI